jgi:predicted RNase H-like HicB family nuclease
MTTTKKTMHRARLVAREKRVRTGETYQVRFYRDTADAKHWIARVLPKELGVHSFGRTIEEARRRVRQALALAIGDVEAKAAVFDEKVDLPADVLSLIKEAIATRARAKEIERAASEKQLRAAERLIRGLKLSLRDAGELLEVSHVAVSKVLRAS